MKLISKTKKIVETYKYEISKYVFYKEVKENNKVNKKLSQLGCLNKRYHPVCIDRKKLVSGIERNFTFCEMFFKGDNSVMVEFVPFKDNDIVLCYYDGHILFDINMTPISLPISFDYIGSLRERFRGDPIYKEIIDKLKIHPYVKELTKKNIEDYNEEFYDQNGINNCTVLLPQDIYKKLYELYKEDKSFSCKMHDVITLNYNINSYIDKIDLYSLNDLVKKYWLEKYK